MAGDGGKVAAGSVAPLKAVAPSRRRRPDPSLDWLRLGDPLKCIAPASRLAAELEPAFRKRIVGLAPRAAEAIGEALQSFARFNRETGPNDGLPLGSTAEITNAHGSSYKRWLVVSRVSAGRARNLLTNSAYLISQARRLLGIANWQLAWPTFKGQDEASHPDVDPKAVAAVGEVLQAQHELWGSALDEGAALSMGGVDPHSVGDGLDGEAWSNAANLAFMMRALAADLLGAPNVIATDWTPRSAVARRWWPTFSIRMLRPRLRGLQVPEPPTCQILARPPMNWLRWAVPTHRDVAFSLLHLLRLTGWNVETGLNVVFTDDWEREAGFDQDGRALSQIRGLKLRTGEYQTFEGPAEGPLSAAQVVRDMIARTKQLRTAAAARLEALRSDEGFSDPAQAAVLTDAVGALWIFFKLNSGRDVKSRVGRLFSRDLPNALNEADLASRGERLPAGGFSANPSGRGSGRRRAGLLPSDFRDDRASAVYTLSGGSVGEVQDALEQDDPQTTKRYLRQPRLVKANKAAVADLLGTVLDEVARYGSIDPAILYLRANKLTFNEEERSRLSETRPRHAGSTCSDDATVEAGASRWGRTLKADDAAIAHPDEFWAGWKGVRTSPSFDPAAFAGMPADAAGLWDSPWEAVADVEVLPGVKLADDRWPIPIDAHDLPRQSAERATVDFRWLLPRGWARAETRSELALRRMKRMGGLLLSCTVVRANGSVVAPPSDATWLQAMHPLVLAGRLALAFREGIDQALDGRHEASGAELPKSRCPDGPPVFATLSREQMDDIASKVPLLKVRVAHRFDGLLGSGVFDDWHEGELDDEGKISVPFPPYNDDFLAALLHGSLRLVSIGPEVLECFQQTLALEQAGRRDEAEALLAGWEGRLLKPGAPMGVSVRPMANVSRQYYKEVLHNWPPPTLSALHRLVRRLEEANYVIISFCTLGRLAEVNTLPRQGLSRSGESQVLQGTARKGSDASAGSARWWPLCADAAMAVRNQQILMAIVAPSGEHLFETWRGKGSEHCDYADVHALGEMLARCLCRGDGRPISELCDGPIHHARFRVSGVRLAALAMPGGEFAMQHFLSHGSLASTIDYVMANPRAAIEVLAVVRRVAAARAKDPAEIDRAPDGARDE